MKNFLKILPIILCSMVMAAHLGRANMFILQYLSLLIPLILILKNRISARVMQLFLIIYGFEWIRTIFLYARIRETRGEDWSRLAIILGVVALLNFATVLVFRTKSMKERYGL